MIAPFEHFDFSRTFGSNVAVNKGDSTSLTVTLVVQNPTSYELARQFIEDAIREKLARECKSGDK